MLGTRYHLLYKYRMSLPQTLPGYLFSGDPRKCEEREAAEGLD